MHLQRLLYIKKKCYFNKISEVIDCYDRSLKGSLKEFGKVKVRQNMHYNYYYII
jgi:hypothetical protein